MLNPTQVKYLSGEAFRALGRRKGLHAMAVLIMSFSLLFLAVFALITLNVDRIFRDARQDLVVRVYLEESIPEETTLELQEKLFRQDGVERVNFVSKEEALHVFKETWVEESILIEALEANPLPASFEVHVSEGLRNPEWLANFSAAILQLRGVESVTYGKDLLEKLEHWLQIFLLVDIIIGLIVIASSVFVVSNTVRLTVISRERSIAVLRMVGATNAFIRTPFLIEGLVQGVLAGSIALLMLRVVYMFVVKRVEGIVYLDTSAMAAFILFCGAMGMLGSFTSVKRFLKI